MIALPHNQTALYLSAFGALVGVIALTSKPAAKTEEPLPAITSPGGGGEVGSPTTSTIARKTEPEPEPVGGRVPEGLSPQLIEELKTHRLVGKGKVSHEPEKAAPGATIAR
jgi:hypothetical protein